MTHRSAVRTVVRRARSGAPLAGAALLAGLAVGAVVGPATAGAATPGPAVATHPSTVLTVPTALRHGYRHGAVPRRTRDVAGVDALGHVPGAPRATRTSTRTLVRYGGGLTAGGLTAAGVTTGQPKVYLVFMGDQWGNESTDAGGQVTFSDDPDRFAPALQTLYAGFGTGGEQWSGIMTQYCDGAATGATTCVEGDTQIPHPSGGVLAGVWYDSSVAATSEEQAGPTGHQLAAEAEAAATYFGNTDQSANRDAQYVIASPTGADPDGWADPRTGYCAYHDDTHDTSIDGGGPVSGPIVAFTNLPYVPDAGYDCGAGDLNTPGTLDGATEAASHEYAETLTDQFPEGSPAAGWMNSQGEEVADLCAYRTSGAGAVFNLVTAAGTEAVQGIWSNRADSCSDGEPDYTYTPVVTGLSTAAAAAGASVTVSGTSLGTATAVEFGGVPGTVTSDGPDAVTASVPAGAVDGAVTVVTTYGTVASTTVFHVTPTVTSFAPTTVARGGTLVISGSGLATVKKVVVGGKKAVVTADGVTQVTVTVGAKATSGTVVVTTKYGTATAGGLTVG